jgi:hypothetical protein
VTHPDDAARRLSEALHAQASRGPMPPGDRGRPPRQAGPPPPAPRVPGRLPPPVPRPSQTAPPVPQQAPRTPARAPGSDGRQIVWALVVTLLVGAILGGGLALLSVLLPGVLPAIG